MRVACRCLLTSGTATATVTFVASPNAGPSNVGFAFGGLPRVRTSGAGKSAPVLAPPLRFGCSAARFAIGPGGLAAAFGAFGALTAGREPGKWTAAMEGVEIADIEVEVVVEAEMGVAAETEVAVGVEIADIEVEVAVEAEMGVAAETEVAVGVEIADIEVEVVVEIEVEVVVEAEMGVAAETDVAVGNEIADIVVEAEMEAAAAMSRVKVDILDVEVDAGLEPEVLGSMKVGVAGVGKTHSTVPAEDGGRGSSTIEARMAAARVGPAVLRKGLLHASAFLRMLAGPASCTTGGTLEWKAAKSPLGAYGERGDGDCVHPALCPNAPL
ncbi:hypothetical protein B0H15DRAFT_805119 [Mycena belliarum]|uniref:Uncharacterized protein n=1 Tax=Mycena belliarum TaxID=1033014 RepID=A0AAD6XKK3_9AGAR|nr:hypothetical protein B0H15DRAFT_805119 [Mycena belliae]